MLNKLKTYFKSKVKLENEVGRLNHQIGLMQVHIQEQREEMKRLERATELARRMWDLSDKTKTY